MLPHGPSNECAGHPHGCDLPGNYLVGLRVPRPSLMGASLERWAWQPPTKL